MAELDIVNKGTETMIFRPEGMLGSKYYRFERAEKLCEYFNKFVNTLKKEREQKLLEENYPWLDPSDK